MMSLKYFDQVVEIFNSYKDAPQAWEWGLVWSEQQIKDAYQKHHVLLEVQNDKVLGFIFYRVLEPKLIDIDMTMTDPGALKMGVMQALFQRLIGSLSQGSEIWLEVHENNFKAINLYKKQGFNVVGRRPRYYPGGGEATLMSLKIE